MYFKGEWEMMKIIKKGTALLTAVLSVMCPASCMDVLAAESTISQMEKKIAGKKEDLEKTEEKIRAAESDIAEKTDALTETNMELDRMEEERLQMYEDIKLRIKYLYENGDTSMMETFITQDGYSKVLNKSELTQEIHKYDREKLEEYSELISDIKNRQDELDKGIMELDSMKKELEYLKDSLEEQIADDEEELDRRRKEEEKRKKEEEAKKKSASYKPVPSGTVQRTGNRYSYCQTDMELLYAITMQECSASYDGALAVITCACNRAESSKWSYIGGDPLTQYTAKGQFCYSLGSQWKRYLNNNVPQYVRDAVSDALNGKRSHQFLSFRGYVVSGGTNIGGNYYFQSM